MDILINIFIWTIIFAFAGFTLWLISTCLVLGVGVIAMVIKLPVDLFKYFVNKYYEHKKLKEVKEIAFSVQHLIASIELKRAFPPVNVGDKSYGDAKVVSKKDNPAVQAKKRSKK